MSGHIVPRIIIGAELLLVPGTDLYLFLPKFPDSIIGAGHRLIPFFAEIPGQRN